MALRKRGHEETFQNGDAFRIYTKMRINFYTCSGPRISINEEFKHSKTDIHIAILKWCCKTDSVSKSLFSTDVERLGITLHSFRTHFFP